jgi:hypothetical protein
VLVLELVRVDQEGFLTVVTLDVCLESGVGNVKDIVGTDRKSANDQRLPLSMITHLSLKAFITLSTCDISSCSFMM